MKKAQKQYLVQHDLGKRRASHAPNLAWAFLVVSAWFALASLYRPLATQAAPTRASWDSVTFVDEEGAVLASMRVEKGTYLLEVYANDGAPVTAALRAQMGPENGRYPRLVVGLEGQQQRVAVGHYSGKAATGIHVQVGGGNDLVMSETGVQSVVALGLGGALPAVLVEASERFSGFICTDHSSGRQASVSVLGGDFSGFSLTEPGALDARVGAFDDGDHWGVKLGDGAVVSTSLLSRRREQHALAFRGDRAETTSAIGLGQDRGFVFAEREDVGRVGVFPE